jgi:GNAT superfamily N-acetyltransferase
MQVAEIDVHDDEQVRAFWAAGKEADGFGRPYAAYRSLEATRVALRNPTIFSDVLALAATEDGQVLGIAEVRAPKLDNTHLAFLEVLVRPGHRGRGVGKALLEAALQLVRDRDRGTVIAEVSMPFESPPQSPGSKFLEHHGFSTASLEIHRVLELPIDPDHLDALEAQAAPHHGDYRLVSFLDRVPDELVEGFCALQGAFNSQAPLGDLDLEPEVWDEARVRQGEARSEQMGRHLQVTLALDPEGDAVALTEMVTNHHLPEVGWQSGTLVLPEHRGHRLGLAIKIANQRRFQEAFPKVSLIHSWNAEENGPMVAINDTIGFRPVEYAAEMQRRL